MTAPLSVTAVAGLIFAVVTAGVITFQVALALGAPWGSFAMGGAFRGRYPPRMRFLAVVQAVLLGIAATIVLSAARLVLLELSQSMPWLVWVVVAFPALALLLNAIMPSAGERRVWVPVTLLMLLSSLTVAVTQR